MNRTNQFFSILLGLQERILMKNNCSTKTTNLMQIGKISLYKEMDEMDENKLADILNEVHHSNRQEKSLKKISNIIKV